MKTSSLEHFEIYCVVEWAICRILIKMIVKLDRIGTTIMRSWFCIEPWKRSNFTWFVLQLCIDWEDPDQTKEMHQELEWCGVQPIEWLLHHRASRGPILLLHGVAAGICQFYGLEDVTESYWGVMRTYGVLQGSTGVLPEPSGVWKLLWNWAEQVGQWRELDQKEAHGQNRENPEAAAVGRDDAPTWYCRGMPGIMCIVNTCDALLCTDYNTCFWGNSGLRMAKWCEHPR